MLPTVRSLDRRHGRAFSALYSQSSFIANQFVTPHAHYGNGVTTCLLTSNSASLSGRPPLLLYSLRWKTSERHAAQRRRATESQSSYIESDKNQDGARPGHEAGLHGTPGSAPAAPAVASSKRAPKQRLRLDEYCMQLAPQHSRNVIQSFILQGKVRVGDKVVTKAGTPVLVGSGGPYVVIDAEAPKYVCRAGLKLEKALAHWAIDVRGVTALDSGQSTGGFTDCLLQHGAAKVYGIDVGFNQLADKIRRDERVVVMEKFNLRHLGPQHLPCKVDIVTLDLSFISVLLVIGSVTRVLRPDGGRLVVLIKPQFEAGRKHVRTGGVVRDPKVHAEVLDRVTKGVIAHGYELVGTTESPIKGDKSGNTEFLAYFIRRPELATEAEASAAAQAAEALMAEAEDSKPTTAVDALPGS